MPRIKFQINVKNDGKVVSMIRKTDHNIEENRKRSVFGINYL